MDFSLILVVAVLCAFLDGLIRSNSKGWYSLQQFMEDSASGIFGEKVQNRKRKAKKSDSEWAKFFIWLGIGFLGLIVLAFLLGVAFLIAMKERNV